MWGFIVILALLIPLIAVILDSQLGRALAARLERDRVGGASDERIAALEGEVERLSRDVRRLEEQAEFLHRLLENKPAKGGALAPGDAND